jgi:hypothetical protein
MVKALGYRAGLRPSHPKPQLQVCFHPVKGQVCGRDECLKSVDDERLLKLRHSRTGDSSSPPYRAADGSASFK